MGIADTGLSSLPIQETTFVCPTYWMAEAFSKSSREAYKYQYSVIPALHFNDVSGFLGHGSPEQGPSFVKAFTVSPPVASPTGWSDLDSTSLAILSL